jgi:hypothetical protein
MARRIREFTNESPTTAQFCLARPRRADECLTPRVLGVVVVDGRAFVRLLRDKPTGRYRTFQTQPLGSTRLAGREIFIRARQLRSERLRDAVTRDHSGKYDTKASAKWMRGFGELQRSDTDIELLLVRSLQAHEAIS